MDSEEPVVRSDFYEAFAKLFCYAAATGPVDACDMLHASILKYVTQLEEMGDEKIKSAFCAGWNARNLYPTAPALEDAASCLEADYRIHLDMGESLSDSSEDE